ncbi:MAG: hypothetical protein FWD49_05540 [Firmicutes bacterium]|nr:hypothetical protein [Bacillota bacterium]
MDAHQIANATEKATNISKCPGCGANIIFDPETCSLKCCFCSNRVDIAVKPSRNIPINLLRDNDISWAKDTVAFVCNNCGAKEIICKGDISKACSFCGATNVVESSDVSGMRPNAVMPFRITKNTASEKVIAWGKKRIFAPKAFKRSAEPEEMKGIFNPAFTFNTNVFATYHGVLERKKTVTTRGADGKPVTKVVTESFRISGNYKDFYEEVTIQASEKIEQKTINKLLPFETKTAREFEEDYLRGSHASQYTKTGTQCWNEAQRLIENEVKRRILAKYTYSRVVSFSMNLTHSETVYKYVLLPLYVGHCLFKHKLYNFFVNGFTGKVTGKTPLSPIKVSFATFIGLALLAGIIALIILFMN